MRRVFSLLVSMLGATGCALAAQTPESPNPAEPFLSRKFFWSLSPPLLAAEQGRKDFCYSVKDPSVVFYNGRWHVFDTTRSTIRSHRVEYVSFRRWEEANASKRHVLNCRGTEYIAAPQVFYFRPQKKWYLIYQAIEKGRKPALQPAYSTTENIEDPNSWSPAALLFDKDPEGVSQWIDFWIICDEKKAYLFFTSMDGRLWRSWTNLKDFPRGFVECKVVLTEDNPDWRLFEAGHIYRLKGARKYLAIIEAIRKAPPSDRRYYVAYTADRLDGEWKPLATSLDNAFASAAPWKGHPAGNVIQPKPRWTDNISHGELIRAGYDETMTVDAANLQFVIQGVLAEDAAGKKYGEIPWRLGILTLTRPK